MRRTLPRITEWITSVSKPSPFYSNYGLNPHFTYPFSYNYLTHSIHLLTAHHPSPLPKKCLPHLADTSASSTAARTAPNTPPAKPNDGPPSTPGNRANHAIPIAIAIAIANITTPTTPITPTPKAVLSTISPTPPTASVGVLRAVGWIRA